MAAYVPDAGDIVWLDFSPQTGHEQAGHRPAVVLSPVAYNRVGLMLYCPLTTKRKGYPFEVAIDNDRQSAALADQVKSLDWGARGAKRKGRVPEEKLSEIRAKARALIAK
jgi:mRNA interferase MazF